MKTLLLMGLLLMSGTLFAQQPIEMKVWPNGAPNANGITEEKNGDTDSPSYTKEAILYVYPAKKGNGMAIVACPGGGYSHSAMAHEGKSMPTGSTARALRMLCSATACPTDTMKCL